MAHTSIMSAKSLGTYIGILLARLSRLLADSARTSLPSFLTEMIHVHKHAAASQPPMGCVRFGSFRRLNPISRLWGFDRGGAIDRYYIEQFLGSHRKNIRGRVLEVSDNLYTRKFGDDRVTQSDVLDLTRNNPKATIVSDLTHGEGIPSEVFDCIILTQTLHVIEDTRSAIQTLYRILKPGGVLLATLPGISQVRPSDWGGYWCGGYLSARRMFGQIFSAPNVEVCTYGNVLAAIAFLEGLGVTELRQEELDYHDPDFEVTVCVYALKPPVSG